MTPATEPTRETAQKVYDIVSLGLSAGLGEPSAGKMCVEAAVCYALGLPHGDDPPCVGAAVRAYKIKLNDADGWPSAKARGEGMLKIAVAQLGSNTIDQGAFAALIAEGTIRRVVPIALRAAASVNPKHAGALEEAAVRCEKEGSREAALAGKMAAYAYAYAYASAADAASAAAYASAAAAYASAAYASAADAADAASAVASAYASAYASASAAADASAAAKHEILLLRADICLSALVRLNSPGVAWLDVIPTEP